MGRIADIKPNDIANGDGVVVSVWFQGCPHRCNKCHNPETWNFDCGEEFTQEHIEKVLKYIDKNGVSRNLAILGGEALCEQNIESTYTLCLKVREAYPDIKIFLWSGYLYEDILNFNLGEEILSYCDVLVDGKFIESKKDLSLKYRGSSNQRVIDLNHSEIGDINEWIE